MKPYFIFIFLLFNLSIISCQDKAPEEIFLIPEGTDVVVLVFEYTHEKNEGKKNDSIRVYNIPKEGVYYTSLPIVEGILNQKIYLVDNSGNKVSEVKDLAFEKYHNRLKDDEIYIIDMYGGKISDKTEVKSVKEKKDGKEVTSRTSKENSKSFMYLTLGTSKSDARELRKRANEIVDSIQKFYPEKYQP